ncbi:MAG: type I-E CRISPR-associated protein Cas6/Cse3/CasE [Hyphomicrobium sp.]
MFQDIPDAKRDFLWRDEGDGKYMILSPRPPTDPHHLFDLETKSFAPALSPGDRLSFVLRANPVVARKEARTAQVLERHGGRARGQKVDIVMDALKSVRPQQRASQRDAIAAKAGTDWLEKQGLASGFSLASPPLIDGYAQQPVERRKGRAAGFSVLNMSGVLEVSDPQAFLARLSKGFGSAKAFGNGLMLIRRA